MSQLTEQLKPYLCIYSYVGHNNENSSCVCSCSHFQLYNSTIIAGGHYGYSEFRWSISNIEAKTQNATAPFVCLLFYVLATSKVILESVPTYDSAHM